MTAPLPPELEADRSLVAWHLRHYPLRHLIPTVLHGPERLPRGGALLVGNHGPLALDTGLLLHTVHRDTDRLARPLGDRLLYQTRLGRGWAKSYGGVEASPENALALLRAGEWVLVYPGGARETLRAPEQRYQLLWDGRFGFARIALRANVPIVPVACVGLDEQLVQVLTHEQVAQSRPGKWLGALIGRKNVPPLYLPRLRRTPFHYWVGEPLTPEPVDTDDADALEAAAARLRARTKAALEDLIERGRQARREALRRAEAPNGPGE